MLTLSGREPFARLPGRLWAVHKCANRLAGQGRRSADRRYAHANLGRYIALAAPGVDVLTASADHAHRVRSGTSFAAAHVSGIIAMMIERSPGLTADAARGTLLATADDLGPPGRDEQYGAGRANAYAAVRLIAR